MKGYSVLRFRLPIGESPAYYGSDVIVRIEEGTEVVDGETVAVRYEVVYQPISDECPVMDIPENATDEERDSIATGNMNRALVWKGQQLSLLEKRTEMLRPVIERDKSRQEGTKRERKPEINQWIRDAIEKHPDKTRPELWALAPEWITDQIGIDRFEKRVSSVRKIVR